MTSIVPSSIGISVSQQLEIRFLLYTAFGVAVIVCNVICLLVLNSSSEFRKKFLLYSFVSATELVNGVSFLATGVGRLILLLDGDFFTPTTSIQCVTTYSWPSLLLIAGTLPACANLSLSLERLFAVRYASVYRSWSNSHKYVLIVGSVLVSLCLYLLAILTSWLFPTQSLSRLCAVMNSTGPYFGTFHYLIICKAYLIGFLLVVYVFRFASKHKTLSRTERRTQHTSMAFLGCCVVFVAIPNYILILDNWRIPKFPELLVGAAYCLYAIQSMSTLVVFLLFRPEFRRRTIEIFFPCHHLRKRENLDVTEQIRTVIPKRRDSLGSPGGNLQTNLSANTTRSLRRISSISNSQDASSY